jgi:hypothetical protein
VKLWPFFLQVADLRLPNCIQFIWLPPCKGRSLCRSSKVRFSLSLSFFLSHLSNNPIVSYVQFEPQALECSTESQCSHGQYERGRHCSTSQRFRVYNAHWLTDYYCFVRFFFLCRPYLVNELKPQHILQDRRKVYAVYPTFL